jgi:hypothetical protein
MYLRCFTDDRPRQWLRWLPWAEYIHNTSFQSSLLETPFRVVYGRDPPTIRSYEPGEARVAAVTQEMEEHAAFLNDVCYHLEQAQAVQKRVYDQHHRPVHYQVADWAVLRLRQRAAASLPRTPTSKLNPRFVDLYRVEEAINDVAIRLQLPTGARLHDVFHVDVLKKFVGTPPSSPSALPPTHHGAVVPTPDKITAAKMACGVRQVLVQWKDEPTASASWEDFDDFHVCFLTFQLEDELVFDGGRDVMCGRTYFRPR